MEAFQVNCVVGANTMELLDERVMEDFRKYVENTAKLLDLEEEGDRAYEEAGHPYEGSRHTRDVFIENLKVMDCVVGLYGHVCIGFDFSKSNLNGGKIYKNNIVGVRPQCETQEVKMKEHSGIVTKVFNDTMNLKVEFDRHFHYAHMVDRKFTLRVKRDSVTNQRMQHVLRRLARNPGKAAYVIQLRFGEVAEPQMPVKSFVRNRYKLFFNSILTELQKKAVDYCMNVPFGLIHGPPGTGKTTTIIELVLQITKDGKRVLVCAPSNAALDNIIEKASKYKVKMVRLGHPAKITSEIVMEYSIDTILSRMESKDTISDVRKDINDAIAQLSIRNTTSAQSYILRCRLNALSTELSKREKRAVKEVLCGSQVVFATLSSASKDGMLRNAPDGFFEAVIIDECAQALEPLAYIAIPWAYRCYVAGDHQQLAPLVTNLEAIQQGLNVSIMERLVTKTGKDTCIMLEHQFRMNKLIMEWVSERFYGGKLIADMNVADQLLYELEGVEITSETVTPLILVNTAGCKLNDYQNSNNLSYGNVGEAEITALMVKRLIDAGLPEKEIAVITPYSEQVQLIMNSVTKLGLSEDLEVQTVDGIQGREKEAIILSFVRSNPKHYLGFIGEPRRTNVAVSRAKRLLCAIGDKDTLNKDRTIKSLMKHITSAGLVISGFEFLKELPIIPLTKGLVKRDRDQAPKKRTVNNIPSEKTLGSICIGSTRGVFNKQRKCTEGNGDIKKNNPSQGESNGKELRRNKFRLNTCTETLSPEPEDDLCAQDYQEVIDYDEKNKGSQAGSTETLSPEPEDDSCAQDYQEAMGYDEKNKGSQAGSTETLSPEPEDDLCAQDYQEAMGYDEKNKGSQAGSTETLSPEPEDDSCAQDYQEAMGYDEKNKGSQAGSTETLSPEPEDDSCAQDYQEAMDYDEKNKGSQAGSTETLSPEPEDDSCAQDYPEAMDYDMENKGFQGGSNVKKYCKHGIPIDTLSPEPEDHDLYAQKVLWAKNYDCKRLGLKGEINIKKFCHELSDAFLTQPWCAKSQQRHTHKRDIEVALGVGKNKDSQGGSYGKKSSGGNEGASSSKPSTSSRANSNKEDDMIKRFAKLNHKCFMYTCKQTITMIYSDCKLCGKRYCIPHSLPEVHGCGLRAIRAARKEFVKPPPKELNPQAKKELEKKMAQKLADMSKERKRANPKEKSK